MGPGVPPPPTTGSSYNILRLFLPSVYIDGGVGRGMVATAGGGRLFFYFTILMFERFNMFPVLVLE